MSKGGNVDVECKQCFKKDKVFPSRAKDYTFCSKECMSKYFTRIKFNKGDFINNWEIISEFPIRKNGRSYLRVKCTCGSNIIINIPISHKESLKHKGCEKCSRFHTSTGYGLISGEYWSLIRNGANKRNIEFNITIEQSWDLYQKQEGRCALSGIDIPFEPNCVHNNKVDYRKKRLASLDRINSSKSYTIDNVQWIHKDVNIMKNRYDEDYFKEICKLIYLKDKNKK